MYCSPESGFICPLPLYFIENYLAQAQMIGGHLHILILFYIFKRLLKAEYYRRMIRALSSAPDARMLVNFFDLVTLTTISLSLAFSPTTCPA